MVVQGEVISLHIGQAGVQAGHAFWTQLCGEHGIGPDGFPVRPKCDPTEYVETLFTHSSKGTYSPRAFCIDTDPGSLDWIRLGECRDLYNPGQMITGKEDAAGCYARGYHHFGNHFSIWGREKIRRVVENCDKFNGFQVFRSLSGGTGSGVSSILMQRLNDHYAKNTTLSLDILPTFQGGCTLDPYNVVLALHQTMEFSDVSFLFSNKSLFRIATNQMGVKHPRFSHVNQIIATVGAQISNGLRFQSDLSMTLAELRTNLVPLPRLKFPVVAYSPFCPPGRGVSDHPLSTLVNNLFTRDAQLVPCDLSNGRYISALLLLRGAFSPDDVNIHIHRLTSLRNTPVRFVNWLPPSMKYALCMRVPTRPFGWDMGQVPRSIVGVFNQSGMEPVIRPYVNSFRKMFCNKAFLHLYKEEGMEELDFIEALENIMALQEDFKIVAEDDDQVPPEMKCVEVKVPREAIEYQRLHTGPCGICRQLNVELEGPLKLRECDKGCGPVPQNVWKCPPCNQLGKISIHGTIVKDMTIHGQKIGGPFRPPCRRLKPKPPPKKVEAGCMLDMGPFCCDACFGILERGPIAPPKRKPKKDLNLIGWSGYRKQMGALFAQFDY